MSQVTKPIALDETLQDVVTAIQGITQGGMIVSTGNVGSATQPVYINGGVPTASDQAFIVTGKIFYVDGATGSDSNDGSQAHPFATIQKAVNSCGTIENNPASRNWGSPGDRIYINTASTYAPFRVIGKRIDFNAYDSSVGALKISTSSSALFGAIDIAWGSYVVFNCAIDVTYTNTSRGAIGVNDAYCRFTQAVTVVSSGNGVAVGMHGHILCDNKIWSISCGIGSTNACIYVGDGGSFHHAGTITCTGGKTGFYTLEGGIITAVNGSFASGMTTGIYVNKGIVSYTGTITNNADTKETLTVGSFLNGKQIITTGTPTNINSKLTLGTYNILKSGNVVNFRIKLTVNTAFTPSESTELFTMPYSSPINNMYFQKQEGTDYGANLKQGSVEMQGAKVIYGSGPWNQLAVNTMILVSGTYLTND